MKYLYLLAFVSTLLFFRAVNGQWWRRKCRALVLEGGGDKGAYQVGAMRGLVEALPAGESQYDVISGVSIGAINGVGLSLFKKGDELAGTQFMVDFWKNLTADNVYANWPGWILEGAIYHTGLYNNTKFVDFLHTNVPYNKIFRKVVVGATNARTGSFVRYTEALGAESLMYNAVRASSAFPGFFQSVDFDNKTLIDGGVLINLDIAGAIERCKETGAREADIIIDIIMCSGDVLQDVDPSQFNAVQMLRRFMQISNYQKTMVWITHGTANWPEVKFRYIVSPKGPISSEWLPMGFDPKEIRKLIDMGKKDAKATVNLGEGVMFKHMTNFWTQSMTDPTKDESFDEFMMRSLNE